VELKTSPLGERGQVEVERKETKWTRTVEVERGLKSSEEGATREGILLFF
jgi:hypothetical protein